MQAGAELSTAIALYRAMDMIFWLPQAEATLVPRPICREPDNDARLSVLRFKRLY